MEASDGAVCPLHRGANQAGSAEPACSMRASCAGPMSALMSMLAAHGILPDCSSLPVPTQTHVRTPLPAEQLASLVPPPDSPPPRG